jgi:hypothetical protein
MLLERINAHIELFSKIGRNKPESLDVCGWEK